MIINKYINMKTIISNKVKNKINIDDFLILMYWVRSFILIEGKQFDFENLFEQAETYKLSDTPLNTNIHYIDDFMIVAYKVYNKLNETMSQFNKVIEILNIPFNSQLMIFEVEKYKNIFEDILENCDFEDVEIIAIQKGVLGEKIKKCVEVEDYERAAKLRDIIKDY